MKMLQLLVATLLLLTSAVVWADKPDPEVPNPPLQVMEANRDITYDAIRVHEQGTVNVDIVDTEELDVNVTGGSIDANVTGGNVTVDNTNANPVPVKGTVTVDNFPGQQGVWVDGGFMSPVTRAYYDVIELDPHGTDSITHAFSVGPILATLIQVSESDDETDTYFYSNSLASGGAILNIDDRGGDSPDHVISLTYPMEIMGYRTTCHNEDLKCHVAITVVGFPAN